MIFPKTPKDLKIEIEKCATQTGDLRVRQLLTLLPKVDDETIIEGVFMTIEDSQNDYLAQKIASRILQELSPTTQNPPNDYLFRILENWDKSCEEVVFWFKEKWGSKKIETLTTELRNKKLLEIQRDKLETVRWWLGIK